MVIPFKGGEHKSRLAAAMSLRQRRSISYLMLEAVLGAVAGAGLRSACVVVTSDRPAMGLARRFGASLAREPGNRGVNAAVELGVLKRPSRKVLVLPGDLPLLAATDIRVALQLGRSAGVVLAPSRGFDGTNLLLFPGRGGFAMSYDSDSFWNHLEEAARRGYRVAVCTRRGLMVDVDTVDDLGMVASAGGGGPVAEMARMVVGGRAY